MTKFNWTYVDFTPSELLIQLDFEHINYISSNNGNPDSIKLTIYGIQFFADRMGNFMYPPTLVEPKSLPPLATKREVKAVLT